MGCGGSRSVAAVEPEPDPSQDRGAAKAAVFLPKDVTNAYDDPLGVAKGKASSQSNSPENPQDDFEEPATAAPSPAADHVDWAASGRPIDGSPAGGDRAGETGESSLLSWGPVGVQDQRPPSTDPAPAASSCGSQPQAVDASAGGAVACSSEEAAEAAEAAEGVGELKKENAELQRLAHEYLEGLENELVTEMKRSVSGGMFQPGQPQQGSASEGAAPSAASASAEEAKEARRAELEGLEREMLELHTEATPPGKAQQSLPAAAALLSVSGLIDEVDCPPGPKPPRVSSPSSTAAGVAGMIWAPSATARSSMGPRMMNTVAASEVHRITNEVWDFDIETSPPSGMSSPVALSSPMSRTSVEGNSKFEETGLHNLAFLEAELEDVLSKLSVPPTSKSRCSSQAPSQAVMGEC